MTTTKKNAIRYISDNEAQVTKAFAKNASIFGTDEFKQWREYLTYYPNRPCPGGKPGFADQRHRETPPL